MKFETKFEIDQSVFVLSESYETAPIDCVICDKSGVVKIKEVDLKCPKCGGAGFIVNLDNLHWIYEKADIEKINMNHFHDYSDGETKQKTYISYYVDCYDVFEEKDVFLSEEEAATECERRNKNK